MAFIRRWAAAATLFLGGAAAILGFIAAVFWLVGSGDVPLQVTYMFETPPNEPLHAALQKSATMNHYAALLSVLAAILSGLGVISSSQIKRAD